MKQHEAVEQAMRTYGGYATLGHLYQSVLKISGCEWGTKTPFASWMAFLNDKRKIVAHASSAVTLSFEDLNQLQEYDKWLLQQITGGQDSEKGEADTQQ